MCVLETMRRLAPLSLLLAAACITTPQNEDLVASTASPVEFIGYWLSGGELIQLQRGPTRDGPWSTFSTVTSSNFALNVYNTDLYAFSTSVVIPGWVATGCGEEVYVRVHAPGSGFNAVTFDGDNAGVEQTGLDCLGDELDAGTPLTKAATNCASKDYPAIRLRTQPLAGATPSNVTISNQTEADEVACYTEIDGSLTIADSSAMSISLAHLERVTGDVHLWYSREIAPTTDPDVRIIDLPSLERVDGSVFVHYPGNPGDIVGIDVGLPALTSVGGDVHVDLVTFNAAMTGMEALQSIGGNVSITTSGDDYTNGTLMNSVATVGGDMDFELGGTTEDLFESLVEVDGSIRIVGAYFNPDTGFGALNFGMLTTVHGDFAIASSTIVTVPGLPYQFPELRTVDGTLEIDAGGINALFVGDEGGMDVGGLRLNQNSGLTDLDVTHVDVSNLGTIEITNNANLGDCEANAFVDAQAAIGWIGTSIVSGNGSC